MASNSLLTKAQRKLLKNDAKEPVTGQRARQDRMRMRKRVTQGLKDISVLNQYARAGDIERIFNREDTDERSDPNTHEPDTRDKYHKTHWVHAMNAVSLFWHGLRLKGMAKDVIFERVICRGIVKGEANFNKVSDASVESDISLNMLEVQVDVTDPVEKWKLGLGLTGEDMQELHSRLSEHPEVDSLVGEDLGELIQEHLISESKNDD